MSPEPSSKNARAATSGTRILIIGFAIVFVFGAWAYWLRRTHSVNYDKFSQCLTTKQVKMYGLYWCTHCADQKQMFGPSFQYVHYIECGIKGSRQEAPECVQANVKNFPAWDFSGSRHEGVLALKDISQLSGCSLP